MSLLLRKRTRYRMIRSIYARGVTGNLSEPWNQGTLYQDNAGTAPVTAVEQGIGYAADTSGSGNHLIQATAASEPVWSKRYNRLTYSEDIGNAAWTKEQVSAPQSGTLQGITAWKITEDNTTNLHRFREAVVSSTGATETVSAIVKAGERTKVYLETSGGIGSNSTRFNLSAGTVETGAGQITNLGGGEYLISLTYVSAGTSGTVWCGLYNGASSYLGDGVSGLYVTAFALHYGSTRRYQSITSVSSYNESGFLPYIKADGVDDSFTCATGAGSTTGFSFQMGVMLEGAAAAQTIYSEAGTNTGIKIERDASNQIVLSGGDGVAYTTATSAAQVTGTGFVLSCFYTGSNLIIQINKNTPVTVPFSTLSAGTTSWTVYKANGAASSYLLCRDYGRAMYKDYVLTDAEKNAGIEFFAAKMGITV